MLVFQNTRNFVADYWYLMLTVHLVVGESTRFLVFLNCYKAILRIWSILHVSANS